MIFIEAEKKCFLTGPDVLSKACRVKGERSMFLRIIHFDIDKLQVQFI